MSQTAAQFDTPTASGIAWYPRVRELAGVGFTHAYAGGFDDGSTTDLTPIERAGLAATLETETRECRRTVPVVDKPIYDANPTIPKG